MKTKYPQPIYYKSGIKYQTTRDFVIDLSEDIPELKDTYFDTKYISIHQGTLTIRSGYGWDGPSGPTTDTPAGMYASLTHDALYQCCRLNMVDRSLREAIDELFKNMLTDAGMWKIRAAIWHTGVDLGAEPYTHWENEPEELSAP